MKFRESKKVLETQEGIMVETSRIKFTSVNEPLIYTTFLRTCTAILIKTQEKACLVHYYSKFTEEDLILSRLIPQMPNIEEKIMFPGIYTSERTMDYLLGKYGPCKLQNPFVLFDYRCYGDETPFFQPVGSIAYDFNTDTLYGYDKSEDKNVLFSYDENCVNISDGKRRNELFLESYKGFQKVRWNDPEEENYGKSL